MRGNISDLFLYQPWINAATELSSQWGFWWTPSEAARAAEKAAAEKIKNNTGKRSITILLPKK